MLLVSLFVLCAALTFMNENLFSMFPNGCVEFEKNVYVKGEL